MKTIVFGDIHGRSIWKDIIKVEGDADRYVFLGDYVTSRENISEEDQIKNLTELFDWADEMNKYTPGRVVLLRGNHDMEALGYSWAECHPRFYNRYLVKNRDWFLEHTQWVFVENDVVYAHAGVTSTWMKNVGLDKVEDINTLEPSEKFGFWPCKFSDYYGDSVTQPPTWIRPWGLFGDSFGKYTYVVGHTTTDDIVFTRQESLDSYLAGYFDDTCPPDQNTIKMIEEANDVITCDTLGKGIYLVVEDGKFIPTKFEK